MTALPPPSKSSVDRAGRRLTAWARGQIGILDEYDPDEDFAVLERWRALFEGPMQSTTVGLRSAIRTCAPDVSLRVNRRFKRSVQILRKLDRETIRLTQMEDIGGCRAVLPTLQDVRAVAARLAEKARKMEIHHVDDYIARPRATGYRAMHLHAIRDGVRVEIQLRTTRQHEWAEQVEDWDDAFGWDLKHGVGPEVVQSYFKVSAAARLQEDHGRSIPSDLLQELDEIRARIRAAAERGWLL